MDNMTLDLFGDMSTEAPTTPASSPAQTVPVTPNPHYEKLLESVMADAGRKAAFKGLDSEHKSRLAIALEMVALAKRAAYDRAVAGEFLSNFDWLNRQPALAAATALLNSAFIDSGAIAMA